MIEKILNCNNYRRMRKVIEKIQIKCLSGSEITFEDIKEYYIAKLKIRNVGDRGYEFKIPREKKQKRNYEQIINSISTSFGFFSR